MTTPTVSKVRGTGYNQLTMPSLSPEQMQLFQQLMGGASGGIGSGLSHLSNLASGDQSYFDQLEAPVLRQFGQLQGNIASRFSGMGSGARRSSGFQNTTNAAAQELAESLSSRRLQYQQDAIRQLLGLGSELLGTRQFENALIPRKKSFWQELLGGAAPGIGQGIGSLPMAFF